MRRLKSLKLLFHACIASFLAPTLILLMILLQMVPLEVPYYKVVMSGLPVLALYFWSFFRPMVLPVTAVFIIGLLNDFLLSDIIGLYTFLYLMIYLLVKGQRRFLRGQGFWVIWAVFMVVMVLFHMLRWGVNYIVTPGIPFNWLEFGAGTLIIILAYPLLMPLLIQIDKVIRRSEGLLS